MAFKIVKFIYLSKYFLWSNALGRFSFLFVMEKLTQKYVNAGHLVLLTCLNLQRHLGAFLFSTRWKMMSLGLSTFHKLIIVD